MDHRLAVHARIFEADILEWSFGDIGVAVLYRLIPERVDKIVVGWFQKSAG